MATLVGSMLILLGGGGTRPSAEPQHLTTYRPATEDERRQRDVQQLQEEMDRLWWEWHTPAPAPSR